MSVLLDELIAQIQGMPADERAALTQEVMQATGGAAWMPSPGPQTDAYFSEADELFFGGNPGGGKDLAIDTPIPIPGGWTTMEDIQVGDVVFDKDGQQCNVVAKSDVFNNEAFELSFSDGAKIIAGANHEWITSSITERNRALRCEPQWMARRRAARPSRALGKKSPLFLASISARNSALAKSMNLPLSSKRTTKEIFESVADAVGRVNHSIEVSGALGIDNADLPIDPYLLGAWLGDGTSASSGMTIAEEEMVCAVGSAMNSGWDIKKGTSKYGYNIRGGFRVALRALGVLGNKHIPTLYLRSSMDQRLALLQGLMDTDGYCNEKGFCEFTQVKRALTEQVAELITSLGIKCKVNEGIAKLNGRIIGPKFRILFLTDLPVFRLARKLIRQKRSGFRGTHCLRYIESVIAVGKRRTQCIQVDSMSRTYLCGKQMVPTHNSDLGVGLSLTAHRRTLFLRRQREEAKEISDRYFEAIGSRDGWNGQDLKLRLKDGRLIDISGCNLESDKQKQKGIPHDLKFFDEIGDFTESIYRFITIWTRSSYPGQRCRVVCAGNPPTTPEGLWVIKYWGPWLDPTHPNPAKPGELRWYLGSEDGDKEVDGPGPYPVDAGGKTVMVRAKSRTFIPSKLADNPYLRDTNYESVLAGLTGDMRTAYFLGRFDATLKDSPGQVIPTAWVKAAQDRWSPQRPHGVPMCAMGVDPTGGGADDCVVAPRYDGYFPELICVPGKQLPFGRDIAGLVVKYRRNHATVIMDMGGGYGNTPYEVLKENEIDIIKYEGYKASDRRTVDGKMKFFNNRAEAYWRFGEALNPDQDGGSPIALPPDPQLVADLTAPTFKITPQGIKVTPKEELVKRLNRSPNRGDAVVMSWFGGARGLMYTQNFQREHGITGRGDRMPVINLGARRSVIQRGGRR